MSHTEQGDAARRGRSGTILRHVRCAKGFFIRFCLPSGLAGGDSSRRTLSWIRIRPVNAIVVKFGVHNSHPSSFFWGTTNNTWDLKGGGSDKDLTPVSPIHSECLQVATETRIT